VRQSEVNAVEMATAHPVDVTKQSESAGGDDEEEEEDLLGFWNALIWLAAITALIAVLSDAISDSIQNAADEAGISGVFIAAILLPIVGNAAEHAGRIISFYFY
jgi:calcium/proton exchanger cax